MSRAPTAPAAPSRPTVVDYVFLLGGCTLSMYLLALSPIHVKPHGDNPSPVLHEFVAYLPATMRLPEGILLGADLLRHPTRAAAAGADGRRMAVGH